MGGMKTFVYYYFHARKLGHPPAKSAIWAYKFCTWWLAKEQDIDVGFAPRLD